MYEEMTIDDAMNVVRLSSTSGSTMTTETSLACAARRLVHHIDEQSLELERERARRHELRRGATRIPDGPRLDDGRDKVGRDGFPPQPGKGTDSRPGLRR